MVEPRRNAIAQPRVLVRRIERRGADRLDRVVAVERPEEVDLARAVGGPGERRRRRSRGRTGARGGDRAPPAEEVGRGDRRPRPRRARATPAMGTRRRIASGACGADGLRGDGGRGVDRDGEAFLLARREADREARADDARLDAALDDRAGSDDVGRAGERAGGAERSARGAAVTTRGRRRCGGIGRWRCSMTSSRSASRRRGGRLVAPSCERRSTMRPMIPISATSPIDAERSEDVRRARDRAPSRGSRGGARSIAREAGSG